MMKKSVAAVALALGLMAGAAAPAAAADTAPAITLNSGKVAAAKAGPDVAQTNTICSWAPRLPMFCYRTWR